VDQPVLVNQSGYDLDRPKRFTAPKAADGETFTITDAAGQTRFTGTVHGQVGDFTAFRPGNSAGGSALSAPHVVGDPVRVDESFSDDFADGTVEPWQPVSGSWQVRDGRLEVTGTVSTLKALASLNGYRYTADLTASAAVRINASRDADSWAGLMVARRRTTDSYTDSGYTAFIRVNGTVVLIKPDPSSPGAVITLGSAASGLDPVAGPVRLRAEVDGDRVRVFGGHGAQPVIDVLDTTYRDGTVALLSTYSQAAFDDVAMSVQ